MAKKKAGKQNGESVAGYFRGLHKENPGLFRERSNDKLLQRWLQDHPGVKEVPKNVKTGLANIKSVLRSKKRKKVAKKAEQSESIEQQKLVKVARVPTGTTKLESLEHE